MSPAAGTSGLRKHEPDVRALCARARSACNKETNVKKRGKRTPPGNRTAANRRKSVSSTEAKPENRELRSRTDSLLPNNHDLDRPPVETDAGKLISHHVTPIARQERPLKFLQQDGMTVVDGDESSVIRTFGTSDPDLGPRLFLQVCATLPPGLRGDCNYVLSVLRGIGPKDALEGLLAAQMAAVSAAAMHFLALATTQGQPAEVVDANANLASKLFRTFTAQMEALNRYRAAISHPLVVGNVNVNDGGQAIVGSVHHSGPEKTKDK
jgi:hypothetical protein